MALRYNSECLWHERGKHSVRITKLNKEGINKVISVPQTCGCKSVICLLLARNISMSPKKSEVNALEFLPSWWNF